MSDPLHGLIPACHTPFNSAGELNIGVIEKQAEHYVNTKVRGVFAGGTTGEGLSLSADERRTLAERWREVTRDTNLYLIVHVGDNSLPVAQELARQAEAIGADGIAALAPSYFKPPAVEDLVAFCQSIASAAPNTPFYYYDIPIMTDVVFQMSDFVTLAIELIPTFAGLKFTNGDFMQLQQIVNIAKAENKEVLFGFDEMLLAALALGVKGAVGSTYNFIAPLYKSVIEAFNAGDLDRARELQLKSVHFIGALVKNGFAASSKFAMSMLGIDCGPVRAPIRNLSDAQKVELRTELESLGFFEYCHAN